jgi:hypothetical protein
MNNINNVCQLKLAEIETVAGCADFWDAAEGALSGAGIGAGAIGFAAAIRAVATADAGGDWWWCTHWRCMGLFRFLIRSCNESFKPKRSRCSGWSQ